MIGPLLGGALIVALGTTTALFLDALSFLGSALLIRAMRFRVTDAPRPQARSSSWIHDLREGISYVRAHPIIRCGALLFLGTNFASTLVQANYIFFLTEILGCGPAELGLAFAIPGCGAVVGALVAPKVRQRVHPEVLILACTIVAGLMTLPLLVAQSALAVAVLWAVVTALGTVNAVTWFTLRQQVVPPHVLGRVVALTRLLAFASIPIAAVVGGVLLNTTQSMSVVILLAASVRLGVGILGFWTPLYRSRSVPAEALATVP
jgi:predicted MFS family arabinose efflux permease